MDNVMIKQQIVAPSLCDNTAKLSVSAMFSLFMDMATEHASALKLSTQDLEGDLFWLAIKTKIKIEKRPDMSSKVTLSTWPKKPVRVRTDRCYTISDENGVMISGKTQWAVIDMKTQKLIRLTDIFGEEFKFPDENSVEEKYAKISDDFSDAQVLCEYVVKSTDIDMGQHMNNTAYVRALFSMFSCKELEEHPVSEIDITYKNQCYEGETLTIKKRVCDDATEYGMIKSDLSVAASIRIVNR